MNTNSIPSFIVIGGQRCGTTWLYGMLKKHPELFFPEKKELHFFNGDNYQDLDLYENYFEPADPDKICGEATPDYLAHIKVPERMFNYIPEVKLIAILRNPVDRAYSAFWIFREFFEGHTFESALKEFPGLLSSGEYVHHLKLWFDYFPKDQIHIILYEDLAKNQQKVLADISRFLCISDYPDGILTDENQVVNAAIFPRFQHFLGNLKLDFIVDLVKKTPLDGIIRKLYFEKNIGRYQKMMPETRNDLIQHYGQLNNELGRLINRDLSHWNDRTE